MSKQLFYASGGVNLNGDVHYLTGAGAPGGTAATDNAPVGSEYRDTGGTGTYQKHTAGSGTDKWTRMVAGTVLGAANGVATLDATGKLTAAQLPDSVAGALAYQGTWDADTNAPAIPAADTANAGHYYRVSVAGTTDVDGITDWGIGDWVISNGTEWQKIDNSEQAETAATTSYDNATSGLSATNVQAALDELASSSVARVSVTGVTTAATADEVSVDAIGAVKWLIRVEDETTPANRVSTELVAMHDGTAGADAVTADYVQYGTVVLGSDIAGLTIDVDLNGTDTAQTMRLRVSATAAATVHVTRLVVG